MARKQFAVYDTQNCALFIEIGEGYNETLLICCCCGECHDCEQIEIDKPMRCTCCNHPMMVSTKVLSYADDEGPVPRGPGGGYSPKP